VNRLSVFWFVAGFVIASPALGQEPDLRGIWQVENTANVNLEGHPATDGLPAGETVIVDPADGRIPYLPEAVVRRDENYRNRATADPQTICFQPGVPRATYVPEPFQIFQEPGRVFIVYQHVHAYRIVYTDRREHYDPGIEFYMGDSRGRWEGSTLVVDVRNFKEGTWLDGAGNYHNTALRVIERYTRTSPDRMVYEATIEDPEVFARPWTIRMELARLSEPEAELVEHECERDATGEWRHPPQFSGVR
jgi:hypothetical protein